MDRREVSGTVATQPGSTAVVIPVWDEYVAFLPGVVESVRQDDPGVRVVVVDNASSTRLPPIDGALIVRSERRLSVGAARNLGIASVESTYVIVVDADDALLPGTLPFLQQRMEGDPGISICAATILDAATGERHRAPRPFVRTLVRLRRTFALADSVWSLLPVQGCALFRTEQVRECGGYPDADWADDWVVAVSLAFRGRVEVHERFGRRYHRTVDSISQAKRTKSDLMQSARLVRGRLRQDPGVPIWAKALLPVIATLQFMAVYALRPVYLRLRRE